MNSTYMKVFGVAVGIVLVLAVGAILGIVGSFRLPGLLYSTTSTSTTIYSSESELANAIDVVDATHKVVHEGDMDYITVSYKFTLRNNSDNDIYVDSFDIDVNYVDAEGFAIYQPGSGSGFVVPANGEATHTGVDNIEQGVVDQIAGIVVQGV